LGNKQQASKQQAGKQQATSSKQQATRNRATKHADNADSKGFSQIRKKSAVIFLNLRHLRAYCLNQDSQDYRMSRMNNKKGQRHERTKSTNNKQKLVHLSTN
jgi:hypothetical protein